ncbi:MAG: hypothetical protein SCJ94_02875 [Bacillota bacterium]|nr:hypothetical protein [Bacillota bacterium]MDW7728939.1 hypothetical protein [Bacillota bacterium]
MDNVDREIATVKAKLEDIRNRWPLHSPKPAMFREREELELKLEELLKEKRTNSIQQAKPENL